jgi:hypothetical protein
MRFLQIPFAILCTLALAGCKHEPDLAVKPPVVSKQSMTPLNRVVGHVIKLNSTLKYVLVEFPTGKLPVPNQRLSVYRMGEKVGEIIVSPQSRESTFAADIVNGDAQVGDEARDD